MTARSSTTSSPFALAGLDATDEQIYRGVLRAPESTRKQLTEVTGLPLPDLETHLERLAAAGLVQLHDGVVIPEAPGHAIGALIAAETKRVQHTSAQIDALRNLLPTLLADHLISGSPGGGAVAVQALRGGDVASVLRSLAEESDGDLLWLRPDQWRLPVTTEVDSLVAELVRSGRRSRAIYPSRVLDEAPEVLRRRSEAGELVRIVASLPIRLSVLGTAAALLPDRWDGNTGRRLIVREHSLVGALTAMFDQLWDQAMSVPGLGGGPPDQEGARRLLLHELAHGAKDEQIARALGLSLRTVRRRIADLMTELGAESRFQAGAEAVRRGWL